MPRVETRCARVSDDDIERQKREPALDDVQSSAARISTSATPVPSASAETEIQFLRRHAVTAATILNHDGTTARRAATLSRVRLASRFARWMGAGRRASLVSADSLLTQLTP